MLLFGPIGTSSSSSQFRLKYPNTRLNDPSGFSSHPSYAGTTFWPVRTTWALVGENPAKTTATTASTPHASASGRESLMPAFTMFDLPQLPQPTERPAGDFKLQIADPIAHQNRQQTGTLQPAITIRYCCRLPTVATGILL